MSEQPGSVDLAIENGVGRIVINNPARHNAISFAMWESLARHLETAAADPAVRVLVLRGAGGKAFAAGADISKFESERASKAASDAYNATSARASELLYNFPRPTIAHVNGYCIGGGLAVALCCDLRFAEDLSRFAIPAARLGLGYGLDGVRRLVDLVGGAAAMEIFFTARQFDAAEALRMGLVNGIAPPDQLGKVVDDCVNRICANAPMTVAAAKAAVRELAKDAAQRNRAAVDAMVAACFASADFVEGRTAFMEKRPPRFQGR